jgi:hypothetical protein
MYVWNINEDDNKQDLNFVINLPVISDDKEELGEVFVETKSFGEAKWLNGTGLIP